MSIHTIHLWKVLKLLDANERLLISEIRSDIRSQIKKEQGIGGGGGDFYGPFWADTKSFVSEGLDLSELTLARVEKNKSRERLYPELRKGFLRWWNEKRRWSNESIEYQKLSIHGRFKCEELSATFKVENLLALKVGGTSERLIYPYFSEEPSLSEETARIALWALSQALPDHQIESMRVLDILRSRSFAVQDYPLRGNEEYLLVQKYKVILNKWDILREEYETRTA